MLKSKRTSAVIAIAIAALIVLVGAFAWNSFSQQRINAFRELVRPGVNLHDDFEEGPDKDVYVENSGEVTVFVRVRLTEYLETAGRGSLIDTHVRDEETAKLGWFPHNGIDSTDSCEISSPYEHGELWTAESFHDYYEWKMGGQKYYKTAVAQLGEEGAFADNPEVCVDMETYDGTEEDVQQTLWADVITMSQWMSGGYTYYDGTKSVTVAADERAFGNFWVVDTDGWCYWAQPLNPKEATGLLLDSVNRTKKQFDSSAEYCINVWLQSVDEVDVGLFRLEQNGGITNQAMLLVFRLNDRYVTGADGELYYAESGGFYRKVDTENNYTMSDPIFAGPNGVPGDDDDIQSGLTLSLDEDGKITENGENTVTIEKVVAGKDGVVYLEVGGGVHLVPVNENGNPDNNGEQYAIAHPGTDSSLGTTDDIGPIRAQGQYPEWYLTDIQPVGGNDIIETGQKGTLVRAEDISGVPAQAFGVEQTVYYVQAITRGENGLLYLKLDEGLYAVALDKAGSPVNLTMSEVIANGEPERAPDVYYIVYPGEDGKIGTDTDATDITPVISDQPVSVSSVYDGAAKTLSVTVSGAGTHTYQWYKDEAPITDAVSNTFGVTDVADSGSYYCRVTTDVKGHSSAVIDTDTVTVSITERPITIKAGNAEKVYDGNPLTYDSYSITSGTLASGDSLSVTVSGSITAVGTADNVASDAKIMRSSTDVTANYNISYINGTLTVSEKSMSGMTINVTSSHTYNGLAQTPIFTVTEGGTELTEGTDFTAEISNNTNAGTALITITGKGNYSEQKTQSFTIGKAALTVTANSQAVTYRDAVPAYGVAYTGFVNSETATALGGTLSYTCTYAAGSNAGSYTITPKGLTSSNYAITFTNGTLTVGAKSLSGAVINITGTYTYNGSAQTPTFTVTDGGVPLTSGTNFTASYANNTNAHATAPTVTITGTGNYTGTAAKAFTISPKPLNASMLTVTGTYTYTGLAQTPTVTVNDGSALTLNTHYNNVNATNNINAGTTASVSVTGIGNYSGTVSKNFTIAQKALTVTANSQAVTFRDAVPAYGVTYSGFVNGQTATALGGTLSYTCTYAAGSNAGSYTITPKGLTSSNYAITFTNGTLTVNPKSLSGAVITVTSSHTYNGSAQTPTFTVTDGGVPLTSGTNFTASYANNTNAHATAPTVTITGTGNYTGTKPQTFAISPKPLNASMLTVTGAYTYTGLAQTPTVTVNDGSVLTLNTHYNNVNATNNINAGTTASVSVTGINNYTGTVSKNFTIAQKALTVTATNKSVIYGDTAPANSVAYSGFVNGEDASKLGGTLAYDCLYTTTSNVGSYPITPKGQTSSNYAISFANGTLTVNKRSITIAALSTGKEYDGNALTYYVYGISSGSLASGEDFSGVIYSGVITDVGSVSNAITGYTILRSGNNVTANYNVSTINGTLTITSPFSGGGAGTSGSPFPIANKADLEKLRDKVNANANFSTGKYFSQTSNIDLNNALWTTPIGNTDINQFKGAYNGNGWKIGNLNVNTGGHSGLFGYVAVGVIKNLYVQGNVASGSEGVAGGIAASLTYSVISDCVFSGNVIGAAVGGIAGGASTSSRIERCYVTYGSEVTTIYATGGAVGGIAGTGTNAEIRSCYSLARVNGTTTLTGGLVGYCQTGTGTIINSVFIRTSALNDKLDVKGSGSGGTVTNSGGVAVPVGGLLTLLNTDQAGTPWIQTNADVSWPVLAAINREHDGWDGKMDADFEYDDVNGIVTLTTPGHVYTVVTLLNQDKYNEIMNKRTYILGADIDLNGIPWTPLGANNTTAAFATTFDGNGYTISGLNVNSTNYAGLFGFLSNATVKNLSVKGNISSSTANFVGGIAGISRDSSTISNCVFSGSIAGSSYVGGIVGAAMNGETIEYCYVADGSKVTNTAVSLGGIAGAIQYGTQVKSCYSLAQVSGSNYVGGVVGAFAYDNTDRVSRCAFLKTGTINSSLYAVGSDTYANTINFTGYFASTNGSLTSNGSPDINSTGTMPANLLALLNGDGQNKYRAASGGENGGYPVLNVMK